MYKIARNVSLVLKYQNKMKKKTFCLLFKKNFWSHTILTNFGQTQNFDFILTYKIYLNWLQSTRNQCQYTFDDIKTPDKNLTLSIFAGLTHYTFMCELTANNFYQRSGVDLKPIPINRFMYQFGFQIVWVSDPSEFFILKCPFLLTVSLLDVQQLKGQCEASAVCGRQVSRWQLDSKPKGLFAVSWPRQAGE